MVKISENILQSNLNNINLILPIKLTKFNSQPFGVTEFVINCKTEMLILLTRNASSEYHEQINGMPEKL